MKNYIKIAIVMVLFMGAYPLSGINNVFYKDNNVTPEKIDKSFNTKSGLKVNINLEIGAEIEVTGWDKEVVNVVCQTTGKNADRVTYDINETSEGVEINAKLTNKHKNAKYDAKVFVKVPVKYSVEYITMGGDVTLKNITGDLRGKTMGGELNFSDLNGSANCQTMGGEITLYKCTLDGKVKTMGGEIRMEDVTGNLSVETMGGEIHQKNVTLKENKSSLDEITIKTMGGDIKVDKVLTESIITTMGGNIEINSAKDDLKVTTMGGDIKVDEMDGEIEAKTMGGNITVNLNGCPENGEINISTMAGNIYLTVPENLGMKIKVQVKGNGSEDMDDYIKSDFKLNIDNDDWEEINADAVIGNGSVRVELTSNMGKVIIKKK